MLQTQSVMAFNVEELITVKHDILTDTQSRKCLIFVPLHLTPPIASPNGYTQDDTYPYT